MTHLRRLIQWLALATCTLTTLPVAMASLVRAMDLTELTSTADQIVVGEVLSTESAWDNDHRNIYSTIEIRVQESWKGSVPNDGRIRIRQLGGTVGEIEMTVRGLARFIPGERTLLFLRQALVVGMGQGKRHVQWNASDKQWMADAPEQSGKVTIDPQGTAPAKEPRGPEALDRIRERVRALLRN
jgi:hypothetical protein